MNGFRLDIDTYVENCETIFKNGRETITPNSDNPCHFHYIYIYIDMVHLSFKISFSSPKTTRATSSGAGNDEDRNGHTMFFFHWVFLVALPHHRWG